MFPQGPRIKSNLIFGEVLKKARDEAKDRSGIARFTEEKYGNVFLSFPEFYSEVLRVASRSQAATHSYQTLAS
jgi:hypothetical protein